MGAGCADALGVGPGSREDRGEAAEARLERFPGVLALPVEAAGARYRLGLNGTFDVHRSVGLEVTGREGRQLQVIARHDQNVVTVAPGREAGERGEGQDSDYDRPSPAMTLHRARLVVGRWNFKPPTIGVSAF